MPIAKSSTDIQDFSEQKVWAQRVIAAMLWAVLAIAIGMGNEKVFAPLLVLNLCFLAFWKCRPPSSNPLDTAAYKSVLLFGVLSALISVVLSVFIPMYADQWSWVEAHADDAAKYPIVNDGIETCYIASVVLVFYFGFYIYGYLKNKRQ